MTIFLFAQYNVLAVIFMLKFTFEQVDVKVVGLQNF